MEAAVALAALPRETFTDRVNVLAAIAQALADTREAAETRAGILVRAGESVHEFGAHDERCLKLPVWSCHPECVVHIVGRALAEYAEAGKASAPAVRR